MAQGVTRDYEQVDVARELIAELGEDNWTPPVQVQITRRDDGKLEMNFRRLERHEFSEEELAAAGDPLFDAAAAPQGEVEDKRGPAETSQ